MQLKMSYGKMTTILCRPQCIKTSYTKYFTLQYALDILSALSQLTINGLHSSKLCFVSIRYGLCVWLDTMAHKTNSAFRYVTVVPQFIYWRQNIRFGYLKLNHLSISVEVSVPIFSTIVYVNTSVLFLCD